MGQGLSPVEERSDGDQQPAWLVDGAGSDAATTSSAATLCVGGEGDENKRCCPSGNGRQQPRTGGIPNGLWLAEGSSAPLGLGLYRSWLGSTGDQGHFTGEDTLSRGQQIRGNDRGHVAVQPFLAAGLEGQRQSWRPTIRRDH